MFSQTPNACLLFRGYSEYETTYQKGL